MIKIKAPHIASLLFCLTLTDAVFANVDPSLLTMPKATTPDMAGTVTLSGAFDETLMNSPRAANVRAQLGISRAAYAQALTLPNPSFFFLEDTAQRARQIGASIPIEPPWKLAFRLLLSKSQIKLTDLEIQRNLWQLRSNVRRAYLDVVMAKETCETLEELEKLSGELLSIAQRRFDAQDVAEYDVERARLANLQTEADLKQSLTRLDQMTERLTVILGRDYKKAVAVQHLPHAYQLHVEANELLPDFSKPLPTLEQLVEDGLKTRMDIKVVEQRIALTKTGVKATIGNIMPNPQFNIGSSYSGNPPEGPATRGFFVGVTQELPVLNFQQGELARLRAVNLQLTRELLSTKNIVTEEVIVAYQQVVAARERVELYQTKILPSSDKVAKMSRRGYEVGQTDITSTLAAQQANVQTKVSYLEAVRGYQQSLTDLEQAIGHPL
ncbi:MAG: TolC family protein [Cyanobacteria bacterium]|nr:TolC family protein [Cyanobacteriota bacterium]